MIDRLTSTPDPKWWTDPWWEHIDYQTEYRLSVEEIRAVFDALRCLFDEPWTRAALEAGPPSAVLPILYGGRGPWPFQHLLSLGRIAAAVHGIATVHRPLRDLIGDKSHATLFELETASWFVEDGWDVTFLKPTISQRTPDLSVQKDGLRTAVECKRFEPERWEEWSTDLSLGLIRRAREFASPQTPSFDILFEPRLSDLSWADEAVRRALLETLVERITDAARRALHSMPPRSIVVPGIAEIRLRPERDGLQPGLGGVGGIEVSAQGKMRRIVQNGILEGATQLVQDAPGAVVIRSDFTPPNELVETTLQAILRADRAHLQSVAVVAIPPSLGSPPVIWRNPEYIDWPVTQRLAAAFQRAFSVPPHVDDR